VIRQTFRNISCPQLWNNDVNRVGTFHVSEYEGTLDFVKCTYAVLNKDVAFELKFE
jgi:hypothetical protein